MLLCCAQWTSRRRHKNIMQCNHKPWNVITYKKCSILDSMHMKTSLSTIRSHAFVLVIISIYIANLPKIVLHSLLLSIIITQHPHKLAHVGCLALGHKARALLAECFLGKYTIVGSECIGTSLILRRHLHEHHLLCSALVQYP